jgi:hypothetical protein
MNSRVLPVRARIGVLVWCALATSLHALRLLAAEPLSGAPQSDVWHWDRGPGHVALRLGEGVLWKFNFGPDRTKPCFHPLATVDGRVITCDAPPDHPWHHGLWFSWKYINGVNYWEADRATGRPEGQTTWSDVRVTTRDDHSARLTMTLDYRGPSGADAVLRELRAIDVHSPTGDSYVIDWTAQFEAREDVVLDRTPPAAGAPGGYAGLSVRFAQQLSDRQATNRDGVVEFSHGDRHRGHGDAFDYSGKLDDGSAGLAILDYPENPRHPTPWYLIRSKNMSYINAAFLHDAPLKLAAGQSFVLRYRVVVHNGRWDAAQLSRASDEYARAQLSPLSSRTGK